MKNKGNASRRKELLVSELLNGNHFFINYEPLEKIINDSILKKEKIFVNWEDVFFPKVVVNQIEKHIQKQKSYFEYVTFLNNIPLLVVANKYKGI